MQYFLVSPYFTITVVVLPLQRTPKAAICPVNPGGAMLMLAVRRFFVEKPFLLLQNNTL